MKTKRTKIRYQTHFSKLHLTELNNRNFLLSFNLDNNKKNIFCINKINIFFFQINMSHFNKYYTVIHLFLNGIIYQRQLEN